MGTKISEVLPAPEQVDTGNGSFGVRGLSLTEIVALIKKHRENFAKLLVLVDGKPDYINIIETAPDMLVDIIALASDNDDEKERKAIARLTLSVQLTAIEKIWMLTVPDVKKIQALLSGVMAALKIKSPSELKSVPHFSAKSTEPSKQAS